MGPSLSLHELRRWDDGVGQVRTMDTCTTIDKSLRHFILKSWTEQLHKVAKKSHTFTASPTVTESFTHWKNTTTTTTVTTILKSPTKLLKQNCHLISQKWKKNNKHSLTLLALLTAYYLSCKECVIKWSAPGQNGFYERTSTWKQYQRPR